MRKTVPVLVLLAVFAVSLAAVVSSVSADGKGKPPPKPTPTQEVKPTATAQEPKATATPVDPKPTATPKEPKPTATAHDPKPTATGDDPKPTATLEQPKPTPTPKPPHGKGDDLDKDGCSTDEELGPDENAGGRRDPKNHWDLYDVTGDHMVDLFGDVFSVASAFNKRTGDPGYALNLDRSAPPGPAQQPDPTQREPWDMGAPDGTITLFADIFGVALQFNHHCKGKP